MTEAERQVWQQERAQGRDRFILRGMFRRGAPFSAILTISIFLFELLTQHVTSLFLHIWNYLVMFVAATAAGGWSEGWKVWHKQEKEYHSQKR